MDAAGPAVKGVNVTALTQCAHWHSPRDIIAIRHKCCGEYYACISCHEASAGHANSLWPRAERNAKAVLCCRAEFNPGCANHYHLYFEM
ncbi:sphinganine kinase lcb4 [Pestalotiopsis sp. IQ-011]